MFCLVKSKGKIGVSRPCLFCRVPSLTTNVYGVSLPEQSVKALCVCFYKFFFYQTEATFCAEAVVCRKEGNVSIIVRWTCLFVIYVQAIKWKHSACTYLLDVSVTRWSQYLVRLGAIYVQAVKRKHFVWFYWCFSKMCEPGILPSRNTAKYDDCSVLGN